MTWPPASKIGWAALLGGAAFLFGALQPAQAQEAGRSPQFEDCLDHVIDNEHGSRWPAVTFCYENELAGQERRLDEAYRKLENRNLPAQTLAGIADSRRQWLAWRDAWCAFEQDYATAPTADIARLTCRIDITKAQLARVTEMAR